MSPKQPRLRILSVGGNSVSAFLSWRLQATNACDVTLVWKSNYEHVAQYGISFRSEVFGNERFKPRHVVRSPEEAATRRDGPYDYVVLCVKALPDVYDLASVIDPVVTPQHTCILVNTTHSLGLEAAIEERFPTNVVLSLVCGADLSQLSQSEFEHRGSIDMWVGPANKNENIPASIQDDMAQALAITLSGGQVDCKVSPNIRQHQLERLIGPIAFHTTSVIFETSNYVELLGKVGVRQIISDVIDEMLAIATFEGCKFGTDFKEHTIDDMSKRQGAESTMWQDFQARRPMEVETYLGSPIRLAKSAGVKVPRIETLYAIMHNLNIQNRQRPKADLVNNGLSQQPGSPTLTAVPSSNQRMSQAPGIRAVSNGIGAPHQRPRGASQLGPPNGMRRPPPPGGRASMMAGPNGFAPRQQSRRGSVEGADLEEFSHVVLYGDGAEGRQGPYPEASDLALRERELQLRQQELALREREMRMKRGPPPGARRGPPPMRNTSNPNYDEDEEDGDYFDPGFPPPGPPINPDNFDMMSVTSRRARSKPSASQLRNNPEFDNPQPSSRSSRFRPSFRSHRSSQVVTAGTLAMHENIMDDPLLGFTSNRYGAVDRGAIHHESRTNSLTTQRLEELNYGGNNSGPNTPMNGSHPRRTSAAPASSYLAQMRGGNGRPSPPNGMNMGGSSPNGRPSPPHGMRQPVPRHPPGHGNAVAPQHVEQHVGVSSLQPPKSKTVRSLTGSASASAGSNDSNHFDSGPSAHSSSSSLGPRPPIGVR